MTEALQFEVKKDKWEQLQNGSYKLTVTMNPTDLADNNDALLLDFIKCAPGSRFILAAVRITEDEKPAVQEPKKSKQKFEDMPPSQQAGIRCNDPAFQEWCRDKAHLQAWAWREDLDVKGATVAYVRGWCSVETRADLDSNSSTRDVWLALDAQYLTDTHLPEQR